jgi:hypothetical protein
VPKRNRAFSAAGESLFQTSINDVKQSLAPSCPFWFLSLFATQLSFFFFLTVPPAGA